uniref:Uncharacterized protein n=1 Tax=Marseillevirus LCMAC103 TaxID=2506604 RepID=A0A481YW81_9VIRU|nr:MAG: hypothetical protein LCMAC103_01590 [Marseillevirus LCMAC103]
MDAIDERICGLLLGEVVATIKRVERSPRGSPEILVTCSNERDAPSDLLDAIEAGLPFPVHLPEGANSRRDLPEGANSRRECEEKFDHFYSPFEYRVGRKLLCFDRGANPGELVVGFCFEISWRRGGGPSFQGLMWLDEAGCWTCRDSYFANACVANGVQSARECYPALRGAKIASVDLECRPDEYTKINGASIRAGAM